MPLDYSEIRAEAQSAGMLPAQAMAVAGIARKVVEERLSDPSDPGLGTGGGLSAPVSKSSLATDVQASLGKADTAIQPSAVADGTALGATRTLSAADMGARFISDAAGAITIPENLNTSGFWIYATGTGAVTVVGGAITAGGNVGVADRRVVNASATPCLLIQRLGTNSFEVRGVKAA